MTQHRSQSTSICQSRSRTSELQCFRVPRTPSVPGAGLAESATRGTATTAVTPSQRTRRLSRPITTRSTPITVNPTDASMRPHSTPPRIHLREIESSDSECDGRCSPLLGLFTNTRGRGKQCERNHDNLPPIPRKSVVGAPIIRTCTTSREGFKRG